MNTATIDRPIATSYEIICALDRRPPSSGYVEPDAQPAEHDAVDAHRRAGQHQQHGHRDVGQLQRRVVAEDATPTGPNGITENAVNARIAEITGAKKNTDLVGAASA